MFDTSLITYGTLPFVINITVKDRTLSVNQNKLPVFNEIIEKRDVL